MVFVETTAFSRRVTTRIADDEYARLQRALMEQPEVGVIIKGSGGIRKIRWGLPGRGKSGGARFIYYWHVARDTILMLDVYTKNEKEDLSDDELKALRRVVDEGSQ